MITRKSHRLSQDPKAALACKQELDHPPGMERNL
jgi:hypothetical protein